MAVRHVHHLQGECETQGNGFFVLFFSSFLFRVIRKEKEATYRRRAGRRHVDAHLKVHARPLLSFFESRHFFSHLQRSSCRALHRMPG